MFPSSLQMARKNQADYQHPTDRRRRSFIKYTWTAIMLIFILLRTTAVAESTGAHDNDAWINDEFTSKPSCSEQFYRSSCLELSPDCQWCCDARVGRQCFNSTETVPDPRTASNSSLSVDASIMKVFTSSIRVDTREDISSQSENIKSFQNENHYCPSTSRVTKKNETCESLCELAGSNCSACESRIWCVFCVHPAPSESDDQSSDTFSSADFVQGYCQSPQRSCPGAKTIQACRAVVLGPPPTWLSRVYHSSIISCALMIGILVLIFSLCGFNLAVKHLRRKVPAWIAYGRNVLERLRHRGEPESDPLLSTDVGNPASESDVPTSSAGTDNRPGDIASGITADANAVRDGVLSEAVAVAVEGGGGQTQVSTMSSAPEEEVSTPSFLEHFDLCCLCLECPAAVTYLPCHHTCCCEHCSNRLRPSTGPTSLPPQRRRGNTQRCIACPMCRTPVEAMVSLRHVFAGGKGREIERPLDRSSTNNDAVPT